MERWEIVLVGAGAAGLMAAWRAARELGTGKVLLLEGNGKPGKKLLATGNGRCNLTNLGAEPCRYHGDRDLAAPLLAQYPPARVLEAFRAMGLVCREDGEGRVYPYNFQAAAVLQALWTACQEAGVQARWDSPVADIRREKGGFLLETAGGEKLLARQCLLCAGGKASPKHSKGEGYSLAEGLGHQVTALRPSLAPLKSPAKCLRSLKGMRARAKAGLYRRGRLVWEESGEVQFGDGALSGICLFDLSARLEGPGPWEVRLDLAEDWEEAQVLGYLKDLRRQHPRRRAGDLLAGFLNLRVGWELVKLSGLAGDLPLAQIGDRQLEAAARLIKSWVFPVTGPGPWESAQVTRGGVPLGEVDLETMESRHCPGLYLTGELLNVDGDCGGFNLHWAWATGLAAGAAAARRAKEGPSC